MGKLRLVPLRALRALFPSFYHPMRPSPACSRMGRRRLLGGPVAMTVSGRPYSSQDSVQFPRLLGEATVDGKGED